MPDTNGVVSDNREMGVNPMRSRRCKGRVIERNLVYEQPLHINMWEGFI